MRTTKLPAFGKRFRFVLDFADFPSSVNSDDDLVRQKKRVHRQSFHFDTEFTGKVFISTRVHT